MTSTLRLTTLSLLLAAGCGGSDTAKYYLLTLGQASAPQGTNCTAAPSNCQIAEALGGDCTETTTEDTGLVVGLYAGSGQNSYLTFPLNNGENALVGTQSNGGYTFSGKYTTDDTSQVTPITDETDTSVSLTAAGSGYTGSVIVETKTSDGTTQSDCTAKSTLTAVPLSSQEVTGVTP